MAEDSTPVPRGSLNKCFAEQHDIANGSFTQWCFDQQQNDLKQLTVQYEDLEDKVELVECFYTQLDGNQEENRGNLEKLEKRVTQLEADLESESELFEERVGTLKTQNVELRIHLNLVIDMVNNITSVLNKTFNNNEPADEARDNTQAVNEPTDEAIVVDDDDDEPTMEDNESMQLTIEASLQKQQELPTKVNGLTQDEWNDLLRI